MIYKKIVVDFSLVLSRLMLAVKLLIFYTSPQLSFNENHDWINFFNEVPHSIKYELNFTYVILIFFNATSMIPDREIE